MRDASRVLEGVPHGTLALLVAVASVGFVAASADPAAGQGPEPEPAPQRRQTPAPEPAPGSVGVAPRSVSTGATTASETTTAPTTAPTTASTSSKASESTSRLPATPFSPQFTPAAAAGTGTTPSRVRRSAVPLGRSAGRQAAEPSTKQAKPRVKGQRKNVRVARERIAPSAVAATPESGHPDSGLLLLGGLALIMLLLGDAVSVALTSRLLRETTKP